MAGYVSANPPYALARAFGRREDDAVVGAAVTVGEHAPHRVIALHMHAHRFAIPQFVADVEIDAFAHDQVTVFVDVDQLPGLALHRPGRARKPRYGNLARWRKFQPEISR